MGWNPETYSYCCGCPHYESIGQYIYELSRPAKRKCKHLQRCRRVAELAKKTELDGQMTLGDLAAHKKGG